LSSSIRACLGHGTGASRRIIRWTLVTTNEVTRGRIAAWALGRRFGWAAGRMTG
jgi:hypothetical protein